LVNFNLSPPKEMLMKQNYIILRSPTAVAPDPFRGPSPLPTATAALWAEQIKSVGFLSSLSLTSRLVGNATLQDLQSGLDPFDIGIGLVRALHCP
jgi:hypothetical protein